MLMDTTRARRAWAEDAIRRVEEDADRGADLRLRVFPLPPSWDIQLYLKDESAHPTGSLKHRLARSLFLFGLANGDIHEGTTLVEASSGSTAVSEAYFARLLGLEFVAVVPEKTSGAKLELIRRYGGRCHLVADEGAAYGEAERLGGQDDWFHLDQFTNASVVTDWRGNNDIACSIFEQMALERHPEPTWIVVGAGTGGTSATIGRYCRYKRLATRVAVVDPEGSVFHRAWETGRRDLVAADSRIEGIGRPRVEPSFVPAVIDEMLPVGDATSIAAMRLLADVTGIRAGASTGTNLAGALELAARMRAAGQSGSIVTLICDGGEQYGDTYYHDDWAGRQGLDLELERRRLLGFLEDDVPAVTGRPDLAALRDDVREFTESVEATVLRPADESVLTRADRARIALRVAQVNRHRGLTAEYAARLDSLAGAGAARIVGDPEHWDELGPAGAALLAHAELMAMDPADAGAAEIALLRERGFTAAQIVAASQVVAYTSYRARLLLGMSLIETARRAPSPPSFAQPSPSAESGPLPRAAERFPVLRWNPWVEPAAPPAKEAGADGKTPAKWSPFYLTLLHDPAVLEERTALYNSIMTGTGSLGRADRELAALATSLVTGCEYCASVHGRRQVQLSKDQVTAVALAERGPAGVTDRRQRAIVDVAAHAAVTPPALTVDDIHRLHDAGLGDDAVRDMIAVAAMFAWANRLMMTLGSAQNPAGTVTERNR